MYILSISEDFQKLQDASVSGKARFFALIQTLLPAASCLVPILTCLDKGLFRSIRIPIGMLSMTLGAIGLALLVLQIISGLANFTGAAVFVNSMADIVYGLLFIIFKSNWPFKNR